MDEVRQQLVERMELREVTQGAGDLSGLSGIAGRMVEFATTTTLQSASMIKSGAGILTLSAGGDYTLTAPKTGTLPVGTGTAGRITEWVTDANTLQAATLIKSGAGILTLSAAADDTFTIGETLTLTAAESGVVVTVPTTGGAGAATLAIMGTYGNTGTLKASTMIATGGEFNTITLPASTDTEGYIYQSGSIIFHTKGSNSLFVGASSGNPAYGGGTNYQNVGAGVGALYALQGGSYNTAVGYYSASSVTSGNYNVAVGHRALRYCATGTENTALGYGALYNAENSKNTALGYQANGYLVNGSSNVVIGYQAGYHSNFQTMSNTLIIASSSTTVPLIFGEFGSYLRVSAYTDWTSSVQDTLRINHETSGTPAAGLGVRLSMTLQSSTTAKMEVAALDALWTDATHATRTALLRGQTIGNAANTGYYGHWNYSAVAGTAITVIPNATGDVTEIITLMYAVAEVTGTGTGGGVVTLTPNGGAVSLYADGTDTLQITCAADGSVTIQRSAGTDTFKVSLWGTWI